MLLSWQLGAKAADGASSPGQVFRGSGAAGDLALQASQEGSAARGSAVLYPLGWSVQKLELARVELPSSPTRKPLGLVAEKLCHIRITSVLLACQSGKNRILNSTST